MSASLAKRIALIAVSIACLIIEPAAFAQGFGIAMVIGVTYVLVRGYFVRRAIARRTQRSVAQSLVRLTYR